jgi:hypothetical protein
MATPVMDLRLRLRNAGVPEEQADAISSAFEALSSQIRELSDQVKSLIVGQRILMALVLLTSAAVLGPYVGALMQLGGT